MRIKDCLIKHSKVIVLEEKFSMPYCADTGAEKSVISARKLSELLELGGIVETTKLKTPVVCETVGKHNIIADTSVLLHIKLQTAAGPVRPIKPYEVLVIDEEEDEFIVGQDILVDLGINIDRQLEQLVRQADVEDDDPIEFDDGGQIGYVPDEEVRQAVDTMIDAAMKNGFPREKEDQLRSIVYMYDIWRLRLGPDPPAKVPPLELRLKKGATPFRCKPRQYPPHVSKFLREFNDELVKLGWVYENASSRWACPALPVRKPGKDEYRQTNDFRPVNAVTEAIAGVMPILQVITENVRDMEFFGLFDFIKGFWQLPLAKASQEILSYTTDAKVFTPTRVPQGCSDAALYFQATMEKCFASLLYKHLLIWIDDLLLYAKDVDTYLDRLYELFTLMDEFGLKLSAAKSTLFQTSVKWCGKIIDGQGVRHDPLRIATLKDMPLPITAGDLQQFLCACNWMRDSLVSYAGHVNSLQKRLDTTLGKGKRTKRAAAKLAVTFTESERAAYSKVKECLANSAMLEHPSPDGVLSVFTDASAEAWSIIVTDVQKWQHDKAIGGQNHRLLQCLSGTFTGSQENWSVIEKEAFAIVAACDKLPHLLLRPTGFRLFCDHRNLIHVFAPDDTVKKHIRGKLLRWAMRLGEFRYQIYHIAGEENVWADMVSRWARFPSKTNLRRVKTRGQQQQGRLLLRPLDDEGFVWPVKHLVTGDERDVHSSRLKFFADKELEVTEELREHVAAQGIVLRVRELLQHRWNDQSRSYEILVGWHGLEPIEDSWEPLVELYKDVSTFVEDYVAQSEDPGLEGHLNGLQKAKRH